jgi:HD superfamily phosphohydrolase
MEFHGMETVVIDVLRTPELQRLRRIRQLGLVYLVFPSAEHSRLAHCLGAAYLAILFGRRLKGVCEELFIPDLCPDESVVRDLGIAALCHDLGHGPLSHYWEREIVGHNFDRVAWAKALGLPEKAHYVQKLKWHELVGHGLLAWEEGQLHRLLEQHESGTSARISSLLQGEYYLPYVPRLLSSDVDVDRADFLRRDTYQTGVAYGRYDLDWMVSTIALGRTDHESNSTWVIGFDERKAVRVLEQFLIARRALYETVYHHKTVRCAEGMVALFLRRLKVAVREGFRPVVADFMNPLVQVMNGEPIGPRDLLKLDDFALWVLIDVVASSDTKDDTLRDLSRRIVARDLFKKIPVSPKKLSEFLLTAHARDRLHEAIKPYCPGEPEYYLIIDQASFSMLSDEESDRLYLINNGKATAAVDHPLFANFRHLNSANVRAYTVREAVPIVSQIIEQGGG